LLLARELRKASILVVAGYREGRADLAPELSAVLEKIGREGEILPLRRLAPEHVGAWMREAFPESSPEQTAAVYQLTEGHPLFVTEVLRGGFQQLTRTSLLDGLRSVLDDRLARLASLTRAALEVAAVLGREFSAADVAAAGGIPLDEIDRALREARDARIVVVEGHGESERLLFSHVLLRDRLYAELTPSRKAALHWSAGTEKLLRGDEPAAAAHHLLEGHSAGDALRAAEVALTAARRALDRFAFEEAVQLCRRAASLPALRARPSRVAASSGSSSPKR